MTVVITNDDGVDAPGLAALVAAARPHGRVVVVAPGEDQSNVSHRVTTGRSLAITRLGPDRYSVDGTPGDCVRLALHVLATDATWVLSGINEGGNLGADIVHSGTVAAAREAVLHGRRSMAFSHYRRSGQAIDWAQAERWVEALIPVLMQEAQGAHQLWNVNLPHRLAAAGTDAQPRAVRCPADTSPLPLAYRDAPAYRYSGDYHQRHRQPGMDIATCFAGDIAISSIGLW